MAVDPYDERAVFVANNSVVARSLDGGCRWEQVWQVPEVPTTQFPFARGEYAAITSLEVTQTKAAPRRVYAALWTSSPVRVHVLRSDDDGETWQLVDGAMPWVGTHPRIRIAPSDPKVVYLSYRLHAGGTTLYYRSRDGGESWTLRSSQPGPASPVFGNDFRVDPAKPQWLWEWDRDDDGEGVRRSRDGGKTWTEIRGVGKPAFPQFVDVFHRRGRPARVIVVNGGRIYRSTEGGGSWKKIPSPHLHDANLLGVAHGTRASAIALVACHAPYCWVFRFSSRAYRRGAFPWVDIMPKYAVPPAFPSTSFLMSTRTERPALLFNAGHDEPTTIERYRGPRWP